MGTATVTDRSAETNGKSNRLTKTLEEKLSHPATSPEFDLKKELPGHVANRFQAALYREMLYLIEQGVLSVEDTDAAVCGAWGQARRTNRR